ncbi:hypothetical protein CTI14_48045 [Methylobacterium radiotolerans]|nr:hypothetical protein CTI14_48045 [Methylobacterium radiotolerans]
MQGVVIDAGIRDAAQIRELGFPVWSKAIYPEGSLLFMALRFVVLLLQPYVMPGIIS